MTELDELTFEKLMGIGAKELADFYEKNLKLRNTEPSEPVECLVFARPDGSIQTVSVDTFEENLHNSQRFNEKMARPITTNSRRRRNTTEEAWKAVPKFNPEPRVEVDLTINEVEPSMYDDSVKRKYDFSTINLETSGTVAMEPVTDWGSTPAPTKSCSVLDYTSQFDYKSDLLDTPAVSAINNMEFEKPGEFMGRSRNHRDPEREKMERIAKYNESHGRKKGNPFSDNPHVHKGTLNKYGDTIKSESNTNGLGVIACLLGLSGLAYFAINFFF